jgi:hypothetical protein
LPGFGVRTLNILPLPVIKDLGIPSKCGDKKGVILNSQNINYLKSRRI